MEITINEHNLKLNEINEYNSKVRAILISEGNEILICNYGGVYLLPGGSVDNEENYTEAIIRELKEEIGQNYSPEEISYFLTINYYQRNYPKRNGKTANRLIQNHYYFGKYKTILKSHQKLTEKENKDNFRLELVSIEKLEDIVLQNVNDNPRNVYFQKELLIVLDQLKKTLPTLTVKKKKLINS